MTVEEKIYEKLEKARMFVAEKLPWFVPVALRARIVIQKLPLMPTMGVTEDWVLVIDPRMAEETEQNFNCMFAHEIVHLAMAHCERMKNYPWEIAQVATDYGFPELLSAEQYAELLMKQKQSGESDGSGEGSEGKNKKQRKGKGGMPKPQGHEGSGATGHKATWEEDVEKKVDGKISEAEKRAARRKMAERIAKQWGDAPDYVKQEVKQILGEGKVNWRDVLQHYAAKGLTSTELKRTYRRLRRPFEEWGVDLPVQRRRQGHDILCVLDTSGSMVDELSKIAAEVQKLLDVVGELEFICADTEIKGEPKKVKSVEEIEWLGGGGTDMVAAVKQAIEYYGNSRRLPDVIIVLTDGYCDWSKLHEIAEPLIIVCITDAPIPEKPNVVIIRAKEDD
jgi:predicted metal-dependent peptidase